MIEPDETFFVDLGGASTNALAFNGLGRGTIDDDDLPVQPGDPGGQCTPGDPSYPNC